MAQTYSLALYSITIHKRLDRSIKAVLTDFDNGNNLYDIAYEMLTSIKYEKEVELEQTKLSEKKDSKEKKFFRIMKAGNYDILEDRRPYLTGIIESGEYGTEENIVNIETGKSRKKTLDDALLRPFYFMLYVPRGAKMAVLLLERISNLGILTVFEKKLQETISQKVGDGMKGYTLTIAPLSMDTVMQKHISIIGGAKKVILNKVKLSNLTASKISEGEIDDSEVGSMELTINAPHNNTINILSWLDQLRKRPTTMKANEVYSVEGVEYGDVKFAVEIGGALRTVSVQDIGKLGTYLDITNQIVLDTNKYPTYISVHQQANILISDIKKKLKENEGQQ